MILLSTPAPFRADSRAMDARSASFALLSLALLGSPLVAREAAPPVERYSQDIKVTPVLTTSTTPDGKPIVYPQTENPEVRIILVEIPPGKETGWHIHPMPCYGYILSGSVTVTTEDGKSATYTEGQGLAELVNVPHIGKNNGTEPTRILMVVTGEKGVPVSDLAKASRLRKKTPEKSAE